MSQILRSPLTIINQKFLRNSKKAVSQIFGKGTLTSCQDFTCSNLTIESLHKASFKFAFDCMKINISYEQQKSYITDFWNGSSYFLTGFYLFKVNNRISANTQERSETCLKLTVRTPE